MSNDILQRAKGVRDFLPEEKIMRDNVIVNLVNVFESFGYNPLETPIIERYELFASKFSQGEESEAVQEGFKLTDRADRKLILRTEFTAPFARVFAMNKNLRLPFKRYQIGQIFRDGPIKLGRYREFYQCDIDVIGIADVVVDAELVDITQFVFDKLGLEIDIYINNRKLLNTILDQVGVPVAMQSSAIISIDKLEKIGADGVAKEMKEKEIDDKQIEEILKIITIKGETNEDTVLKLREVVKDQSSLDEIAKTLEYITQKQNVIFEPSLARGLGYYTGNIFEVFLKDKSMMSSSLAGGGRYDEMIGSFLQEDKQYPAIGISFGLEAIIDVLKELNKDKENKKVVVDYYALALGGDESLKELIEIVRPLQQQGIKIDINYNQKSFKKALEYANAENIPYVLVLGEDELKEGVIVLKNMDSGDQEKIKLGDLANKLNK